MINTLLHSLTPFFCIPFRPIRKSTSKIGVLGENKTVGADSIYLWGASGPLDDILIRRLQEGDCFSRFVRAINVKVKCVKSSGVYFVFIKIFSGK